MKVPIAQQRILAGQCPLCGKEAAPYRLCWDHRFDQRLRRSLKRGVRLGALKMDALKRYTVSDGDKKGEWAKHATQVILPESDKRGRPRLRNISVDVEATLTKVIERIGRPCTIEEISAAWGRLRSKRSQPLAADLATIIAADDKRARKMAKRAALSKTERE
jgi:hypothetical protein